MNTVKRENKSIVEKQERQAFMRKVFDTAASHSELDLALGYLRYEALRKLNARQYAELLERNIACENFDHAVDKLVMKG